MNHRVERTLQRARLARLIVGVAVLGVMAASVSAQRGGGAAAPAAAPQSPQAAAPIDLTGYWVSIVNEDWRWRMVTPPKGDYASVPISPEGRKVADTWDVSKDGSCLAFGAAGLMRMPTRLNITWENPNTLKIDTDAGQQTRRLVFDRSVTPPSTRSLQGFSVAEWERPAAGRGGGRRRWWRWWWRWGWRRTGCSACCCARWAAACGSSACGAARPALRQSEGRDDSAERRVVASQRRPVQRERDYDRVLRSVRRA